MRLPLFGPAEKSALKLAGLDLKTKWTVTKIEAAGTTTEMKIWMSDDVPGMMVKSESMTKGAFASSTKIELIEFKKPSYGSHELTAGW